MNRYFRSLFLISVLGIIICSCTGQNSQPVTPDVAISPSELTGNAEIPSDSDESSHYLLAYDFIYIDPEAPDGPKIEIIPVRETEIHLNILKFLEDGPCFNCFKIVGFNFPQPGYLDVDIQIDHPFDDLYYSVFDVRGIMMFRGSHEFPVAGKSISESVLGDGMLLNPDGYTSLYNGTTITSPVGDLQKYYPGNLATSIVPSSEINGYKYFISDDPANDRNALYANTSDVQTFSLKLPTGPFIMGYAVDANWWPPIESTVDNPLTDFDLSANCPEPWKIVVTEEPIGDGLTDEGGSAKLIIDVYDWQGKSTHHEPIVECPELFDDSLTGIWASDGADYARYEVNISNAKLAVVGDYLSLVKVEANENDPVNKPWLDLTAYQLQVLTIVEKPTVNPIAVADADPNPQTVNLPISFSGSNSYDPDGGTIQLFEWDWNNDGTYDATGENVDHTWTSYGNYFVQLRVTDDEAQTDTLDEPLEINIAPAESGNLIWVKRAGGTSTDQGYGITTLSDNSTVVTGWFEGSATFGPGEPNQTVLTSAGTMGYEDIFIARYNPDGTLAWAKSA
ncbi:MAG: PKD domain-containing protein, partial [bacterium]|nr:PKD domain-containing protein [bacterium]